MKHTSQGVLPHACWLESVNNLTNWPPTFCTLLFGFNYIHYFPAFFAQLRTSRSGVGAFLWDFTKAPVFTLVSTCLSHSGVGALFRDFTKALLSHPLCFLDFWICRMVLFELLWPFCMFLLNVLMMYYIIWCLWP